MAGHVLACTCVRRTEEEIAAIINAWKTCGAPMAHARPSLITHACVLSHGRALSAIATAVPHRPLPALRGCVRRLLRAGRLEIPGAVSERCSLQSATLLMTSDWQAEAAAAAAVQLANPSGCARCEGWSPDYRSGRGVKAACTGPLSRPCRLGAEEKRRRKEGVARSTRELADWGTVCKSAAPLQTARVRV